MGADQQYENTDHTSTSQSTDGGIETEGDDLGAESDSSERRAGGSGEKQRLDLSPRKKMGLGAKRRSKRSEAGTGAILNLSKVGVDDETLGRVRYRLAPEPFLALRA